MPSSIQGQLLRRNTRREVAIFLRDGALWVADFVDGDGEIVDATTWFRFNCTGVRPTKPARRRMEHECAMPLSEDIVRRIERLPPIRLPNPSTSDHQEIAMTNVVQFKGARSRVLRPFMMLAVALFAVAGIAFGTMLVAEHAISASSASPAMDSTSKGGTPLFDAAAPTDAPFAPSPSIELPRECRLDAGIDTQCMFQ
jgi:hypothetical protein